MLLLGKKKRRKFPSTFSLLEDPIRLAPRVSERIKDIPPFKSAGFPDFVSGTIFLFKRKSPAAFDWPTSIQLKQNISNWFQFKKKKVFEFYKDVRCCHISKFLKIVITDNLNIILSTRNVERFIFFFN